MIAGTPTVVMILDSVLAGAIAAIATLRVGAAPSTALLVGVLGFAIATVAQSWYSRQSIAKAQAGHHPLFPTPEG